LIHLLVLSLFLVPALALYLMLVVLPLEKHPPNQIQI
jgi:hypothetical protein